MLHLTISIKFSTFLCNFPLRWGRSSEVDYANVLLRTVFVLHASCFRSVPRSKQCLGLWSPLLGKRHECMSVHSPPSDIDPLYPPPPPVSKRVIGLVVTNAGCLHYYCWYTAKAVCFLQKKTVSC
jgi:hypothetical protein